ncbi:hypothetical protein L8956_21955 [Peribacillus frigoritolerans]|uniref:hypothetical protein n=1 Tax=Peribacillus frigoritolerans TaxID=450367 RepID=UPI001EFDB9BA|nr:hypothetical protein [Peribacillus frigoritolerans]ULM96436.1 hypothetical protein L8956_21955 [Peribacillus frigoritolerans]
MGISVKSHVRFIQEVIFESNVGESDLFRIVIEDFLKRSSPLLIIHVLKRLPHRMCPAVIPEPSLTCSILDDPVGGAAVNRFDVSFWWRRGSPPL